VRENTGEKERGAKTCKRSKSSFGKIADFRLWGHAGVKKPMDVEQAPVQDHLKKIWQGVALYQVVMSPVCNICPRTKYKGSQAREPEGREKRNA